MNVPVFTFLIYFDFAIMETACPANSDWYTEPGVTSETTGICPANAILQDNTSNADDAKPVSGDAEGIPDEQDHAVVSTNTEAVDVEPTKVEHDVVEALENEAECVLSSSNRNEVCDGDAEGIPDEPDRPVVSTNPEVVNEEPKMERHEAEASGNEAECAASSSDGGANSVPNCEQDANMSQRGDQPKGRGCSSEEYPPEYSAFCGHKFDENHVLRDMKGEKFQFSFFNHRTTDQARYEEIGEAIDEYVYDLLYTRCNMIRHFVPFDASPDEVQGFFFASENATQTEDKLLILIHGSGVVRAGQWARRIIINDNLMDGSQIPYVEQAQEENYEVVVLNTNHNSVGGRSIRGSESPERHASYVWNNFIMKKVKAKHIAIMAHSYGGCVTLHLAKSETESFLDRVFAVAFSDSVHFMGPSVDKRVNKFFFKHARNWVSSSDDLDTVQRTFGTWGSFAKDVLRVSAGDLRHEWTSATSMKSVFKFFEEEFAKKSNAVSDESSGSDDSRRHDDDDDARRYSDDGDARRHSDDDDVQRHNDDDDVRRHSGSFDSFEEVGSIVEIEPFRNLHVVEKKDGSNGEETKDAGDLRDAEGMGEARNAGLDGESEGPPVVPVVQNPEEQSDLKETLI